MSYIKDMKMLTLKKQAGDALLIGDESIMVNILELDEQSVTLGFLGGSDKLVLIEEKILSHIKLFDKNEPSSEDKQIDP